MCECCGNTIDLCVCNFWPEDDGEVPYDPDIYAGWAEGLHAEYDHGDF